jgi:hypothetical protein
MPASGQSDHSSLPNIGNRASNSITRSPIKVRSGPLGWHNESGPDDRSGPSSCSMFARCRSTGLTLMNSSSGIRMRRSGRRTDVSELPAARSSVASRSREWPGRGLVPGRGDRFRAIAGLSDDGAVRFAVQDEAHSATNQRVLVGEQDADSRLFRHVIHLRAGAVRIGSPERRPEERLRGPGSPR